MQVADNVSLQLIRDGRDTQAPESELLIDGQSTGTIISGAILEAAIRFGNNLVLFTTDDVPFEDMLGIHLLDDKLKMFDSALLGAPYSTGSFSILRLEEPNRVHFRFIGDTDWTLELLDEPSLRNPFSRDAPGVRRRFGFTRHFIVRGRPKPAVSSERLREVGEASLTIGLLPQVQPVDAVRLKQFEQLTDALLLFDEVCKVERFNGGRLGYAL